MSACTCTHLRPARSCGRGFCGGSATTYRTASLYIGRAHTRRGIRDGHDGKTGGLTTTRTKLNSAAKLSKRTGPPLGSEMPDAAKNVRQLVLLHGRDAAKAMVEPEAKSLVRIASEVLSDERGRSGYSYSGLCLTSLPHRKLADEQAWERSVGPLTLIIEPGRLKVGSGPSKLIGVPYGAR